MLKFVALVAVMGFGMGSAMAADSPIAADQVSQETQRVIVQGAGGSVADTTQQGSGHRAETVQSGRGNVSIIRQSGSGNTAISRQSGTDLRQDLNQQGDNLGVTVTQNGAAGNIRIHQTSPGQGGATIFQQGPGAVTVR